MRHGRWHEASPFEVVLLIASVASGTFVLVGNDVPRSLTATLPGWAQLIWSIGITLGAVVALLGLTLRDPVDARLIELGGLVVLVISLATYALALLIVQGPTGVVVAALNVAYGIACGWRVVQLWHVVRLYVRDAQKEP